MDHPNDTGDGVTHLDASLLALYLDRRATEPEGARVEQHLASCPGCRADWVAAQGVVQSPRARHPMLVLVPLAAAATLVLLLMPQGRSPGHREPLVVTTQAPVGIAPSGNVTGPGAMVWSRVPGADRYRVSVFDSAGRVLWEQATPDTAMALPSSVRLAPHAVHFWRVYARTGYDRWVESSLMEFRIEAP